MKVVRHTKSQFKLMEKTLTMTLKAERPGITQLKSWLNKNMKVLMSDGRVLVGIFLCTDKYTSDTRRECGFTSVSFYRAGNVIIGSCNEYTRDPDTENDLDMEPRLLGLAMVPGNHIARMWVDNVKEPVRPTSPAAEDEGS